MTNSSRNERRNRIERLADLMSPSLIPSPESAARLADRCCLRCHWSFDAAYPEGTRPRGLYEPETHFPETCAWASRGCPDCHLGKRIIDGTVYCSLCEYGERAYRAALQERQEATRAELRSRRALYWEFMSGIPPRFRLLELTASPLSPGLVSALRRREGQKRPESWLLHGEFGRGKTGAAVAYARQWVFPADPYELPISVLFRPLPDLLTEIKSTYGQDGRQSEADLIESYRHADLLILDDCGAEQVGNTGWLEDRLYQIIGGRHGQLDKPIVFTSNLSPDQLSERLGERVFWRIYEMCSEENVLEVKGPNLRQVRPTVGRES